MIKILSVSRQRVPSTAVSCAKNDKKKKKKNKNKTNGRAKKQKQSAGAPVVAISASKSEHDIKQAEMKAYQATERQFAQQQVATALIHADFAERAMAGPEANFLFGPLLSYVDTYTYKHTASKINCDCEMENIITRK